MNKYNMQLPEFKAFQIIRLGNNTLSNTKHLFNISGYYPLIIGKGDIMPKVWMYALIDGKVINVVSNSFSQIFPIKFDYNESTHRLVYKFIDQATNKEICLLNVVAQENECKIEELNLYPLGLKIRLDGETLVLGNVNMENNNFTGNTFVSVE